MWQLNLNIKSDPVSMTAYNSFVPVRPDTFHTPRVYGHEGRATSMGCMHRHGGRNRGFSPSVSFQANEISRCSLLQFEATCTVAKYTKQGSNRHNGNFNSCNAIFHKFLVLPACCFRFCNYHRVSYRHINIFKPLKSTEKWQQTKSSMY